MLFTTGLGTPTGNPIAPVVKISTNTTLAERMSDIIDFDAGPIVSGKSTIKESAEKLLELSHRSGQRRAADQVRTERPERLHSVEAGRFTVRKL